MCLEETCDDQFIKVDCPGKAMETTTEVTKMHSDEDYGNTVNQTEPVSESEITDSGDSFTEAEIESEHFRCKPGMSFKLECNTCWCRSDGDGPKYCTRIACNPKTYKPLTQNNLE